MRRLGLKCIPANILLSITAFLLIFAGVLWDYLPYFVIQMMLPVSGVLILLLTVQWSRSQRQQEAEFANDICETAHVCHSMWVEPGGQFAGVIPLLIRCGF